MGRLIKLAAVLLSAVLLSLPYHFDALWFLAFFALVPLMWAIHKLEPTEAFKLSFVFGVSFYLLLGYWLTYVSLVGYLVLAFYLALYPAFFGRFAVYFLSPRDEIETHNWKFHMLSVLAIPAFWVAGEYIRGFMISGLPWALLAYTQWKNIVFIQIADLFGAWGVSFVMMMVNVLIFKIMNASPYRKRFTVLLCVLLSIIWLYGMFCLNRWDAFYKRSGDQARVRVGLIQGNIPQEEKWDTRIKNIIFEKYKRLTMMAAVEKSDLIIWPETSFPGYLEDEALMSAQLRSLVRQTGTEVLVGVPTLGNLERDGVKFYNSAIHFGPNGEERKRYHKMHLVPFGEYVPMESVIGFIRNFVSIGHFSPGKEPTIFTLTTRYRDPNIRARFGVLICYEDIFPSLVRRFRLAGADFLVNMTNDAWFGRTSAPYQHAQASVFRAIENRVPVVRATNTGLSGYINAQGRLTATVQDNGEEIFITGHASEDIILRRQAPSLYTRLGDWFIFIVGLLCFSAYRVNHRRHAYSRF